MVDPIQIPINGPVEGVDLSVANPLPKWDQVPAEIVFAYLKFGQGATYKDPKFVEHLNAARGANRLVGAYQFGKPDEDPKDDALAMLEAGHHKLDLPPALDLEVMNGRPAKVVLEWAEGWLRTVEEQGDGTIPVLYTGPAFWNSLWQALKTEPGAEWAHWPLWLSQYGASKPMLVKPYKFVTMWQYAANTIAQLPDGTQLWGAAAAKAVAEGRARLLARPGIVPGIQGEVDRDRLLV